uniref:Uncharacterized protein n=1 Tax=Timema monikensis TaxID=170555 RepID=A0A7R9HR90_9NEOP|nr:unnamed protein product [Timema monikensis]
MPLQTSIALSKSSPPTCAIDIFLFYVLELHLLSLFEREWLSAWSETVSMSQCLNGRVVLNWYLVPERYCTDPELCVSLGFSLQYIRLTVFCWLAAMTHDMYTTFSCSAKVQLISTISALPEMFLTGKPTISNQCEFAFDNACALQPEASRQLRCPL